jgi:hypothetical protein
MEASQRLKYLRRQKNLERRLPEFLSSLSNIAGQQITHDDVSSIEETDNVWAKIRNNDELLQISISISFPYRNKQIFNRVLETLFSTLSGKRQYFTTDKFYQECFLLLDTSFCINNYEKVIETDGDAFYIYDNDLSNGLCIDTHEEHWEDKAEYLWTYELKVFGLDWVDKIFNTYKEVIRKT